MECLDNSPENPEQGKSWRLLGFHNKQLISVSSSCLFRTDKNLTDLGQRNVPVSVSQSWHTWFPPYYLSFYLSASDVLNHSFCTESSIFSLKLALSVGKKKNKKVMENVAVVLGTAVPDSHLAWISIPLLTSRIISLEGKQRTWCSVTEWLQLICWINQSRPTSCSLNSQ